MNGVSLLGVSNEVSPSPITLSGYVPWHLFLAAYFMVVFLVQNLLSLAPWLMSIISRNNSMVWSPFFACRPPTELYAALNRVHLDVAKRMTDILNDRCVKVASGLIFHKYSLGSHTMNFTMRILCPFCKQSFDLCAILNINQVMQDEWTVWRGSQYVPMR